MRIIVTGMVPESGDWCGTCERCKALIEAHRTELQDDGTVRCSVCGSLVLLSDPAVRIVVLPESITRGEHDERGDTVRPEEKLRVRGAPA